MIERTTFNAPQAQGRLARIGRTANTGQALRINVILIVTALVTVMLYLYVVPNSHMSAANARIAELKAQKAALVRHNADLQRQIAAFTDLGSIERRARAMGMGLPSRYIYLATDGETSRRPAAAQDGVEAVKTASSAAAVTGPAERSDVVDWLRQGWQTISTLFDRIRLQP